ncbi:MAG: NfeD family protein [Clostridia bacterium]|nr:NfeD family protein [Clostridia bacterium]
MNTWLIAWGIIFVLAIVVELSTMALVSIWFALGAIPAAIMAAFKLPSWSQILVFAVVAVLCFILFWKKLTARRNENKTNAPALVGKQCVVIEEINNLAETGRVQIGGLTWAAVSEGGGTIPEESIVEIVEIRGVHLICRKVS